MKNPEQKDKGTNNNSACHEDCHQGLQDSGFLNQCPESAKAGFEDTDRTMTMFSHLQIWLSSRSLGQVYSISLVCVGRIKTEKDPTADTKILNS